MIATIYFHGPATNWGKKVAPGEIIATIEGRWLWLLRKQVLQAMKPLNAGRCGYVIQDGEEVLELVEATNLELVP